MNGDLRVNGQNARGINAGGGSGGSVYVMTQRLDGSGKIQVKLVHFFCDRPHNLLTDTTTVSLVLV